MGSVGCGMGGASPPILSGIASRMKLAHGRGMASHSTLSRVGEALGHKVEGELEEEVVPWLALVLKIRTTRYS
jgi:hypothetical protein